jgi:hypothetical protein
VPLLDEVATYLVAQGVGSMGTTSAWRIFKGFGYPSTGRAIVLTETPAPNQHGHSGATLDNKSFQVLVRGPVNGYSTGLAKGEAVRTALELIGNETMTGRYYPMVLLASGPIPLGQDENNQPRLSWNFLALRSKTT